LTLLPQAHPTIDAGDAFPELHSGACGDDNEAGAKPRAFNHKQLC